MDLIANYLGLSREFLTTGKEPSGNDAQYNDIPPEYIAMAREFHHKAIEPKKLKQIWDMFEQINEDK